MVMRIAELRKSECCPVIGQIEVALPLWNHITSPETEPTSRWYSNSRTFAEPMNEATQMTTAQAVGAVSSEAAEWHAIDWQAVHCNVRRLQARIVKAVKEGRWG